MSAKRTAWGWNRLSRRSAFDLVKQATISPGDLVLDVGAGGGRVTQPLVDAGARVIAIELHSRRVCELRQKFASENVVVVHADAADLKLPRRPFRVVANPPFSIVVQLMKRLVAPGSRLIRADLVVPCHVAKRWVEGRVPGAARWHLDFEVRIARSISPHAFRPRPPYPVCLLVIERRRR